MKKILFTLTFLVSSLASSSSFALGVNDFHPFASVGLGIAIFDDNIGQINETYGIYENGEIIERSFQSDEGLSVSADGGIALWDILRAGIYLQNNTAFDQRHGNIALEERNPAYDPSADDNADGTDDEEFIATGEEINLRFHPINVFTVGAFLGAQFELGAGTATRHYVYFDYAPGWLFQSAGVRGYEHSKTASFSHGVRAGINVPNVFQKIGTGLELTWLFPQDSDTARTFAINVKASYNF